MKRELIEAGFAVISEVRDSLYVHYHGSAIVVDINKSGMVNIFYELEDPTMELQWDIEPESDTILIKEVIGRSLCNATFYVSAEDRFGTILEIVDKIIPYASTNGFTYLPNTSLLCGGDNVAEFTDQFDTKYYYLTLKRGAGEYVERLS